MDNLIDKLPEIIREAAQSYLGILALLSITISALAYFFFAKSSEKTKVGIFVLLFLSVIGFGSAMFLAKPTIVNPPNTPDESTDPIKKTTDSYATPIGESKISPPLVPSVHADRQDDHNGRCKSYKDFRAACIDADASGTSAIIAVVACDMVRISEIRISDASGHDYRIDKNSTTFEVPPGNKKRNSKVEIFYKSLSDNKARVKSILVNRFGQCVP